MKEYTFLDVLFSPSEEHITQVRTWLSEEYNKTREGFKRNWPLILQAANRGCMAVLLNNGKAIGFAIWSAMEFHATLDFFCIEMGQRKKGLGTYFGERLLDEFKTRNKVAVQLQCSPLESESFWRKQSFVDIAHQNLVEIYHNKWLYRSLIETAKLQIFKTRAIFLCFGMKNRQP